MTTLPQNTLPRTNRPAGFPAAASAQTGMPAQGGLTGADVVRVLRGNIWLILALLVVSVVVGYVVNMYLAKTSSRYTATGYCEVRLASTANPLGRGPSPYLDNQTTLLEQRTQVQQLRNEALFSRVLQNQNSAIRNTKWFNSFPTPSEARQDLLKNFSVNAVGETRLISISMQYSEPDDARIVVQEIVDEHLRQQQQAALNNSFDRSQVLNTMKLRQEADLRSAQQDRQEVAKQLTELGVSPATNISPLTIEIDATTKSLIEARERASAVQVQLDMFKQAADSGTDPYMIVRMVDENDEIKSLTQRVEGLNSAIESMSDRSESPQYKSLKKDLDFATKKLEEKRREMITKLKATVPEDLDRQLKSSNNAVEAITKRLGELQGKQSEIANMLSRYQSLIARETFLQSNLREINESIEMTSNGGGTVIQWAGNGSGRPIKPEIPSFPKLPVTLTVAVTIGLLLALGIAFAIELMDTTIRSPRDVAKVGPLAVLGMIPHEDDDPQSAGARLPLVIAEAPQSMTAEQLRQLRTRLQHATSLDTTRSLLVTSPNPGDGKTTVAVNLAAGLALVGRRILLVDANFRRPELHRLFEIDNTQGFSNALSSPDQLPTLAKPSKKVPNLSVLAAGPKPGNTTEMLESSLLHQFIDKALEQYDHIIFDSGPVLFASETVALAPRVDGVVTVVRARQSTRGVLSRVRETLRQIKAENLGVVINGVRAYGGGYYARNIKTYYEYSGNGNA